MVTAWDGFGWRMVLGFEALDGFTVSGLAFSALSPAEGGLPTDFNAIVASGGCFSDLSGGVGVSWHVLGVSGSPCSLEVAKGACVPV